MQLSNILGARFPWKEPELQLSIKLMRSRDGSEPSRDLDDFRTDVSS